MIIIVVMLQIFKRVLDTKIPDMIQDMFKVYCRNIIPYMYLYKHQVEYYEKTVYNILEKDIGMIFTKIWKYGK